MLRKKGSKRLHAGYVVNKQIQKCCYGHAYEGNKYTVFSFTGKIKKRDIALGRLNVKVIRFNNFDLMTAINLVVDSIAVQVKKNF